MPYYNPKTGTFQADNPWGGQPSQQDEFNNALQNWKTNVVKNASYNPPPFKGAVEGSGNLSRAYTLYGKPSTLPEYEKRLGESNDILANLKQRGTAVGPSAWAQLMLQKQGIEEGQAGDRAAALNNAGTTKAFDDLAARGGLSAGQRASIAMKGARDLTGTRQDVFRQGVLDRLGINTADENQKIDIMKSLPGMYTSNANAWGQMANANRAYDTGIEQSNIAMLANNANAENKYNMDRWSGNMQNYGNLMQSQAQENAGKK